MGLLNYFDLSYRKTRTPSITKDGVTIQPPPPSFIATEPKGGGILEQILLYLALVIGVFFSNAVMNFKSGQNFEIVFSWAIIIISFVIAIAIMPAVYRSLQADTSTNFITKFGMFVSSGISWQTLIGLVGKITAPPPTPGT